LKFKKGREGKKKKKAYKEFEQDREEDFFVCCPCLRGQVGKRVEEMWWKDRIVCGR
jgi:hypothetical protein